VSNEDDADEDVASDTAPEAFSDREKVKAAALRAIGDVRPVTDPERYEYFGTRTDAGRQLPPPYLVYFLLVDLLEFPSTGAGEKVAWSVPVTLRGKDFVVSHRKLGLGVFAADPAVDNDLAREITNRIQKAVKQARPFFDWLALHAVTRSKLNVVNNARSLFGRFEYVLKLYRAKCQEAEARKDERIVTEHKSDLGTKSRGRSPSSHSSERLAGWLFLSSRHSSAGRNTSSFTWRS
jgi:hypothetical protein